MTKPQGFLATFRIDEELWGNFKDIAKNKQTSASALIIQYIQGVVSSGAVDPKVTPQNIDNLPKLSIQDIEKIVDEKINSSIQINTPSIQNITGQFNGLIDELRQLKKQMESLQSNPPAPIPEQLTTDNGQLTKDIECDRTDSDLTSDTQLIPDPNKNQIENIRTTLKRKGVQPITNDQIRKAFSDAGWDGKNYQELRQAVIDSLSRQNNDKVP